MILLILYIEMIRKLTTNKLEIFISKYFLEKKEPHIKNRKTNVKQFSNEFRYKHRRSQTGKKTGMSKVSSHGKHTLDMIK